VTQEVSVSGVKLDLTAYEYKVLEYLMFRKGELISKSVLMAHIYDEDFDRDSNVIEVFIGRLRKKLDPDGTRKPIEHCADEVTGFLPVILDHLRLYHSTYLKRLYMRAKSLSFRLLIAEGLVLAAFFALVCYCS